LIKKKTRFSRFNPKNNRKIISKNRVKIQLDIDLNQLIDLSLVEDRMIVKQTTPYQISQTITRALEMKKNQSIALKKIWKIQNVSRLFIY
jgi:hypothetical protein